MPFYELSIKFWSDETPDHPAIKNIVSGLTKANQATRGRTIAERLDGPILQTLFNFESEVSKFTSAALHITDRMIEKKPRKPSKLEKEKLDLSAKNS